MTRAPRSPSSRPTPRPADPELLDETRAAALLGKKVRTLRKWRADGSGPKFTKIGRAIYYRKTRIYEWLEQCEVSSNEEARSVHTAGGR